MGCLRIILEVYWSLTNPFIDPLTSKVISHIVLYCIIIQLYPIPLFQQSWFFSIHAFLCGPGRQTRAYKFIGCWVGVAVRIADDATFYTGNNPDSKCHSIRTCLKDFDPEPKCERSTWNGLSTCPSHWVIAFLLIKWIHTGTVMSILLSRTGTGVISETLLEFYTYVPQGI